MPIAPARGGGEGVAAGPAAHHGDGSTCPRCPHAGAAGPRPAPLTPQMPSYLPKVWGPLKRKPQVPPPPPGGRRPNTARVPSPQRPFTRSKVFPKRPGAGASGDTTQHDPYQRHPNPHRPDPFMRMFNAEDGSARFPDAPRVMREVRERVSQQRGSSRERWASSGAPQSPAPPAPPTTAHLAEEAATDRPSLHAQWTADTQARVDMVKDGFQLHDESLGRLLHSLAGRSMLRSDDTVEDHPEIDDEALRGDAGVLSDGWARVSRWLDMFHQDTMGRALACRVDRLLGTAYDADRRRGRRHPNLALSSAALASLDSLLLLLQRQQRRLRPAIRATRREVAGAMFLRPPDFPSDDDADALVEPPKGAAQESWSLPPASADEVWERAVAERIEATSRARPWYAVARDLGARVGKGEQDLLDAERRRDRMARTMERGIRYWQNHVAGLLLRSWRAEKVRSRGEGERDKELRRAQSEAAALRADLKALTEELAQEREAREKEREKAARQIQTMYDMKMNEEQLRKEKEVEIDRLEDELKRLNTELWETRDKMAGLQKDIKKLGGYYKQVVMQCIEGPEWEVCRQEDCKHFINDLSNFSDSTLLAWINTAARKSTTAETPIGMSVETAESFLQVYKLFDPYAMCMNWMSPHTVSHEDAMQVLETADCDVKAELILEFAQELGVLVPLRGSDLAMPTAVVEHMIFTASLFQRFADSGLATAQGHPQLAGPQDGAEHPLWVYLPENHEEWKERIDKGWKRVGRWRGAGRMAQAFATDVMLAKLQNRQPKVLSELERTQQQLYCRDPVDPERLCFKGIRDLLPPPAASGTSETGEPVAGGRCPLGDAVRNICALLDENYRSLRKIYQFYSSGDTRATDTEISLDEAWKLICDARLNSKTVTRQFVRQLFTKANIDDEESPGSPQKDGKAVAAGSDCTLNPTEYVQLLLHLAYRKYQDHGTPLGDRLRLLLIKHVLAHSNWTDAEEFKEMIYRRDIQDVLRAHRPFALAVFDAYCLRGRRKADKIEDARTMRMDTFVELCKDMHITDAVLTHEAVRQVFLKMQDSDDNDLKASFKEFLECLCAIAAFKNPAPYLPLHRRISRFFEVWFVPSLSDQVKLAPRSSHDRSGHALKPDARSQTVPAGRATSPI